MGAFRSLILPRVAVAVRRSLALRLARCGVVALKAGCSIPAVFSALPRTLGSARCSARSGAGVPVPVPAPSVAGVKSS